MPEDLTVDKSTIKGSFNLSSHTIIALIGLVTGGGVFWGAQQVAPTAKAQIAQVAGEHDKHAERIAVLESEMRDMRGQLARIDRKLDVLIERKVSAAQ